MAELKVERLDEATLGDHLALSRAVYGETLSSNAGHFWWKHGENPDGRSWSVSLRGADGALAGRSVVQPHAFRTGAGTVRPGALVVDVAFAPEGRSAMQFLRVVRAQAQVPGIDVLVHTSNETSEPLYAKLLKYPVAFRLEAFALPLRARGLAAKLAGRRMPGVVEWLAAPWRGGIAGAAAAWRVAAGLAVEDGVPDAAELEALLQAFRAAAGPHFDRTPAFWRWRFGSGPQFNGRMLAIRRRGRLAAVLAWRMVELDGLAFFVVMDLVAAPGLGPAFRTALWLELARRAAREGADLLFTMANRGNPLLGSLVGAPLVRVPDRFLPHPSPIYVIPRATDLAWLQRHGSTFMTLADLDYF